MSPAYLALACLVLSSGVEVARPTHSSSITRLRDGTGLAVANLDAHSVTVLTTWPFLKQAEIPVGQHPRSVAASRDGRTLLVTLPDADRVVCVDLRKRQKTGELQVPGGPFAVVAHPRAEKAYVAAAYANLVAEVNLQTMSIARQLPVARTPRGLSLSADGRRLYVVHFFTGQLSIIDTVQWQVAGTIANRPDANLARCVALGPDGRAAYLPHLRSNVTNPRLQFDTTVFPVVSRFDLVARSDLAGQRIALDAIGYPANNPWEAVVSDDGSRLLVVNAGSDDLQVIDLSTGKSLAHIDVGANPRGIVLSADGLFAYVHNVLSHDISVVGTSSLRQLFCVPVTEPTLRPEIARGKILFNSARPRSITLDRWISCASCHPDGESDGRTWQFAAGPRKTPSLRGAGQTLPHNLSPDRDEIQDSEHFIRHVMGGTGLIPGRSAPDKLGPPSAGRSEDADALAAFILSLSVRPSPFARGGPERLAAIERGRAIFFSRRAGCASCHPPPYYSDSQLTAEPWKVHDVGTGHGPAERRGTRFDTPSLLGLYAARRYLHDGRATSLAEVLTTHNREDRHGVTSHLGASDVADLVAFLRSLPAELD
jgi:YVTN family beta-propeller protein